MIMDSSLSNQPLGVLQLQAMGEPKIVLEGNPIVLPTRHATQALFLLALADDGELLVPELGEQLWPDAAASQIPPRFATMVWQLKKVLSEHRDLLERNRRVVRIDREKVSVDVVALRAQALECIANASRNAELVAKLRRPILAPWNDFPWVQEQQEINERLASQLAG